MNRFTYFSCIVAFFWLIQVGTWAQSSDQCAYTQPDSLTAYWKLRAAPTDPTPTVQFYNAHHQLLYQEILPASARRIDRSTKRALDRFLMNLVSRQILTTTYLTQQAEGLIPIVSTPASAAERELRHLVFRKGTAVLSVEPSLIALGKVMIACAQASNRWLWVRLEDADQQEIFRNRFKTGVFKCVINLTQLPSGQYYLKAGLQSRPAVYRLLIDRPSQQYILYKGNQ